MTKYNFIICIKLLNLLLALYVNTIYIYIYINSLKKESSNNFFNVNKMQVSCNNYYDIPHFCPNFTIGLIRFSSIFTT